MMKFLPQFQLNMMSLMSLTLVPLGLALQGQAKPTCFTSSEPPKAQLQPIWDRLNQTPVFELRSQSTANGESGSGIEQYVQPNRYRRITYDSLAPQSQALAESIETIVVNAQIYTRIRDKQEFLKTSDPVAFHTRQPYLGKYFPTAKVTNLEITGPVMLPSGENTCVYSYKKTSTDSSGKIIDRIYETLWVEPETMILRQLISKSTTYTLTPPYVLERKTTVHYPESLTIELPTQPQL